MLKLQIVKDDKDALSMTQPEVSVLVVTFNHAQYIKQCLDSLLSQDYVNYKIYIGDDCSTDGTAAIIRDYASKYPEKIKARLNEANMGSHPNFKKLIGECSSDWFAICEGDDFWIDNSKLTKQMKALANNPNCIMCFSQAVVLDVNKTRFSNSFLLSPPTQRRIFTREDFLRNDFAQNCTCVYKKDSYLKLGDWHSNFIFGDYSFQLESLKEGDAFFINEPLAVYRVHATGIWSNNTEISRLRHQIEFLAFYYKKELDTDAKNQILKNMIEKYSRLLRLRLRENLKGAAAIQVAGYLRKATMLKYAWRVIRLLHFQSIVFKMIQIDIGRSGSNTTNALTA